MKDEHIRIKERERGMLARAILENPVYQEAWEAQMARLREFLELGKTDEETLEAKRGLTVLRHVRSSIENVMTTGQLAERQLDDGDH